MGQLDARTLEDLEGELQERAFARDAELMMGTARGVVLVQAVAGDMHVARECLLAADAERASARHR